MIRALTLAALIGAGAGWWTWTKPGVVAPDDGERVVTMIVFDNGFHTDVALPREALERGDGPLAEAVRTLPPSPWIRIGWGDARFYVDQSPISDRLPDGARAFFAPGNASVVMLDPVHEDLAATAGAHAGEDVVGAPLTEGELRRLVARVEGSLALKDGRAIVATQRSTDDARFYASTETFGIGHLCNHWTAGLLNVAGRPVQPAQSVLSGSVMRSAQTYRQ